jgi:glycosyltransferase involved in cell wall biosynthesis
MKQNKFKIIIASYNNEDWVEYNIASVLNQTYTNYSVVYVNDCSTDNTSKLVHDMVGTNERFTIIENDTNLGADGGAIYNYVRFYETLEDDEICVSMCGDDWLINEHVLDNLNRFYNEKDVWMTYGEFYAYDGSDTVTKADPQNTPYPDFVHDYKLYRRDVWRASHLLTFRGFLAKAIDLNDIKSRYNEKWFYHAPDLAVAFPCMEMCPKDKIGVVDFPTYIWNASEQCQARTRIRESQDNMKYEVEIRNKKHYKEGLTGEKLPQINAFGGSRENNSMPTKFSYVYDLVDGEFDLTIFADMAILDFLSGKVDIKRGKVVADIHEPPYLFTQQQVYDEVYKNYHRFDRILTYDERLLTLPNAIFRNGGYECVLNKSVHTCEYPTLMDTSLFRVYPKNKKLSFITSNKTFTDGHKFRVSCVEALRTSQLPVDVYGVGYNTIPAKLQGLKDHQYSIAIENGVYQNYFTEKILDCFLTGTIPIYKGCPNIGDFFNMDGIITFNTQEELLDIVAYLQNNDYIVDSSIIQDNFNRALSYQYNNDALYEKFIQNLIN